MSECRPSWTLAWPSALQLVVYYRDIWVILVTFKIVVRYHPFFQVVLVRSRVSVIFWSPGLM